LAQSGFSNFEFIENKGQWDKSVRFKTTVPNGNIFLGSRGFAIRIHNPDDLQKMQEMAHGHPFTETSPVNVKSAPAPLPAGGRTPPMVVHGHAYQVEFVDASESVEISGDKPLSSNNNYFIGNDPSKWASHCRIFQAIVYKNIYPGIDLRYYTANGTLKYDLVIHPGANPDKILMRYKGMDKLTVKNNQVVTHTSVGDIKELVPSTYQFSAAGKSDVDCRYEAGPGNTVRFRLGHYSKDATVVIDPSLVFSTFTGSPADNWGYAATYDLAGNFYSGSIVLNDQGSANGFASPGAFQTTFAGGDGSDGGFEYDIGIMKFNSTGSTRMYATYIGGSGNEQPHSLVVDGSGNLVLAGRTSSPDYPVMPAGIDKPKGGYDIVLTKLNADGSQLIGSRMIGGSADDGVNISPKYSTSPISMGQHSLRLNYGDDGRSEVILDGSNNVYLASCTQSSNFFTTPNAFQKANAGHQDGVFIKTSPDLSVILASSYLGGSNDDAAFALALNPTNGDVFVAGGTSSIDFPGINGGPVYANKIAGGIDGFLSIISGDGGTLRKTSYFGTPGTEVLYGVQFDAKGFPYIMGTTTGAWPTLNATFVQAGGKQFLAKLKPDISGFVYSTTFGPATPFPNISPTAFLVDRCENLYVAGWGGGIETEGTAVYNNSKTFNLPIAGSQVIKANTDGDDFYFFVLQKNAASQLYGSFFGQQGGRVGDHVDGGTSRFDKQGIIYEAICANCYGGASFPTTPGVWSPKNGTGVQGCNLAAVKIAFNFAGVGADARSLINGVYDSTGCVPLTVVFNDTVRNAKSYLWNFGDGGGDSATTSYRVTHTYGRVGPYRVRLIAIDSASCNVADTAYVDIFARNDMALLSFLSTKLSPCQSLSYQFDNTSVPPAGKPFLPNSFTWDFGDNNRQVGGNPVTHAYLSPGTYIVQLILNDTNYCNNPDSTQKTLRVSPLVKASFQTPALGCAPYQAYFNNTSLAGQQFFWTFGDNNSSTDMNPTNLYTDTGVYTVKLVVIDSGTCNIIDSATQVITVHSKPTAAFTVQPVPPQPNIPNVFFNNSSNAVRYKWLFGDGDSVLKNNQDTTIHQYQSTSTFQACLIAFNEFDCTDTVCHPVDVLINPLLDVPNAFTPGRFGQNSIIYVHGFGISSMIWRIYNRWGQVVFESNNPNMGWDGSSKGVQQPMDVYTYTLEASFEDGTKTTRKGDITLLR
jgi:gliding motility-associated-like protein